MQKYLVDVAVLLIFFNRPDTFRCVFEQVKKARPSRLYLSCDGAREGNQDDLIKIAECKRIAEDIDWDCQVYHNYSDVNLGCGKGPKAGMDFMFRQEEYGVILEDDCIPSISFFSFCKDVLEKYRDDERIFCITGINAEKESKDCEDSYFFGVSGTNCGWATWKRNWDKIDYQMRFMQAEYIGKLLLENSKLWNGKRRAIKEYKRLYNDYERISQGENVSFWDEQWHMVRQLNHQLCVIPSKNLITNIGVGADSTHAKTVHADLKRGETVGKPSVLFNRRYEIEFPLKHPDYVIQNVVYDKMFKKAFYDNFWLKVKWKLKTLFYK